jgi:hypothetical protein
MPAPIEILDLIRKRDEAQNAYVEARQKVNDTYTAFLDAQDALCVAILDTGTDTFIDEDGHTHTARTGGRGTVSTVKVLPGG